MARELRNSEEYGNIYISPDLTPQKQQRDKALRDEVKRRRSQGEEVEIRRGRVVVKEGRRQQQMPHTSPAAPPPTGDAENELQPVPEPSASTGSSYGVTSASTESSRQ